MKKLIAILLVLVMAASAVVTIAAETDTAVSPEINAPTVLGYQVGDYYDEDTGEKVEGYVNVRFVSYVTSLDADVLGYDIKAYYTNGNDGNVKTFAATDDPETTTEYNKVFKYILVNKLGEDGEPVQVISSVADVLDNDSVEGYFFLYSVKKIPASADLFFEINTYAKVGEEKVATSETTTLYCDADGENVNGEMVSTTYNFSEAAVTPADFGAKGKFADVGQYYIENGKLVVDSTMAKWSTPTIDGVKAKGPNCYTTLLSSEKLAAALRNGEGYHQSYVVSMDLEFVYDTAIQVFAVILNGENTTSSATDSTLNGTAVRLQGVTKAGKVNANNALRVSSGYYNSSNLYGAYNTHYSHKADTESALKFNLAYAYTYSATGGRIDIFINGTNVQNISVAATNATPGLKFVDNDNSGDLGANDTILSDITLLAQDLGSNVKIDNLTVSVPVDTKSGVVNTSTNKLNALKDTYKATYDVPGKLGITPVATTINKAPADISIDNGSLKMVAGDNWGSHLVTLAPADLVNADNGKVIVDMNLTMNNGKKMTVFFINNIASDSSLVSHKRITNTGAVGCQLVAGDKSLQSVLVTYDKTGSEAARDESNTLNGFGSNVFNIRIIADGSTYSLYVNGEHAFTKSYAKDNDKVINANTSLVLWTQNTEFTISNLTISTFQ